MKEYFVIVVSVRYGMQNCDWGRGKFDTYPTNEQIENALRSVKNADNYSTVEVPQVYHARVEKRFELI